MSPVQGRISGSLEWRLSRGETGAAPTAAGAGVATSAVTGTVAGGGLPAIGQSLICSWRRLSSTTPSAAPGGGVVALSSFGAQLIAITAANTLVWGHASAILVEGDAPQVRVAVIPQLSAAYHSPLPITSSLMTTSDHG